MQEEWEKMKAEGEKYKPENKVAENMRFFDILSKRVQGIFFDQPKANSYEQEKCQLLQLL